jgi:hypothetical protein
LKPELLRREILLALRRRLAAGKEQKSPDEQIAMGKPNPNLSNYKITAIVSSIDNRTYPQPNPLPPDAGDADRGERSGEEQARIEKSPAVRLWIL